MSGEKTGTASGHGTPSYPARETTQNFAWLAALIASIITIIATIASWHVLKTILARSFAIAGSIILIIVAVLIYQSVKDKHFSWRSAIEMLGISALCICVSVVLVSTLGSHAPSTVNSLPQLRFVGVAPNQPEECTTYLGTGSIPAGYSLLIFTSSSPTGPYYLTRGVAENLQSGGWRTPLVMSGNDPTYISAVLASSSLANFAQSINTVKAYTQTSISNVSWLAASLPPSQETIPYVMVWPTLNGNGCSPA